MSRVKNIPVVDSNGDPMTVHEFYDGRFLGKVRRRKLCTGALVERTSADTFKVIETGEELLQL